MDLEPNHEEKPALAPQNYNPTVAFLLAVALGYLGIDRFYTGQIGSGVAKLLTVGRLGLWWIVDILVFGVEAFAGSRTSSRPPQQAAPSAQFVDQLGRTGGAAPAEVHSPPAPLGNGIEPWTKSSTMTEVVGEFHRPGTYEYLFRGLPADGSWSRFGTKASLYPDPRNPHRAGHAVAVWIDGLHAGFLASGNAARYFQVLDQLASRGQFITTQSRVSGRYDSRKKQWTAEVQINLPEPDLILPRNELPAGDHALIPAGRAIQVVEESRYMDSLGPLTDGTTISCAVTLHAIHEVRPRSSFETVEVRIDGRAVGILSKAMAETVSPLVELIERRGAVPVARATVTGNALGAEVTLSMIKASEAEVAWVESIQQRPLVGRAASADQEDGWGD